MATDIIARAIGQSAKDKTDKITVNNNINLDIVSSTLAEITNIIDTLENSGIDAEARADLASNSLKLAKVEKDLNDYQQTISGINPNQEPTQQATGYGIVSLPKNAANGQVSVSVKGNTETDEEGNTKSTVSATRLKSVGKNLFNINDKDVAYGGWVNNLGGITFDGTADTTGFIKVKPNTTYYTNKTVNEVIGYYDKYKNFIFRGSFRDIFTTPSNCYFVRITCKPVTTFIPTLIVSETPVTVYEPYTESELYVTAYDENGDVAELRSLPNGVKDEIDVTDRKLIKRIGEKSNIANGMVIDFADMAEGGTYYAWNEDGETETGIKGDTLGIDATTLTYQLATPIEIPIQTSGSLVSYPSGTVYIEPFVADAGIYTDKMSVLHQDLPIKALEKISKVDFETGVETELDPAQAIIAADKLSFTHPDLEAGDIVFFVYEYDRESTVGETEIEYYDSRYTIKDSVTDKFYKWNVTVADGVPSIELVEV